MGYCVAFEMAHDTAIPQDDRAVAGLHDLVQTMRDDLDELVGDGDEQRLEGLAAIFKTGVRLERGFWDMAYALSGWADAPSGT